jgi:hypothetical protein
MAFTWHEVVQAFIEDAVLRRGNPNQGDPDDDHAEDVTGHVTVGLRAAAQGGGYIRIWGPNANPRRATTSYLVVQRYNASLGVTSDLAPHIDGAAPLNGEASIHQDPLGASAGPRLGRFTHGIHPDLMGPGGRYPTAEALVTSVKAAFGKARIQW